MYLEKYHQTDASEALSILDGNYAKASSHLNIQVEMNDDLDRCPRCKIPYHKEGGCSYITCYACECKFDHQTKTIGARGSYEFRGSLAMTLDAGTEFDPRDRMEKSPNYYIYKTYEAAYMRSKVEAHYEGIERTSEIEPLTFVNLQAKLTYQQFLFPHEIFDLDVPLDLDENPEKPSLENRLLAYKIRRSLRSLPHAKINLYNKYETTLLSYNVKKEGMIEYTLHSFKFIANKRDISPSRYSWMIYFGLMFSMEIYIETDYSKAYFYKDYPTSYITRIVEFMKKTLGLPYEGDAEPPALEYEFKFLELAMDEGAEKFRRDMKGDRSGLLFTRADEVDLRRIILNDKTLKESYFLYVMKTQLYLKNPYNFNIWFTEKLYRTPLVQDILRNLKSISMSES
jgi:hypothetical protein